MIKVVLLGYGNVNSHLLKNFHKSREVEVCQVFSRHIPEEYPSYGAVDFVHSLSDIDSADVYLMGIADDAIGSFSDGLPFEGKLVVHTSGAVALKTLSDKNRRGVFYPLQTFSKHREVNFTDIPIFIEAENAKDLELLRKLGNSISTAVEEISSEKRKKLHLAAVFVNNFVNYLYQMGADILAKENISFDALKPLIMETAAKITDLSPQQAQTGPAKRRDIKTIENHLELLPEGPFRQIYSMFTQQIAGEDIFLNHKR